MAAYKLPKGVKENEVYEHLEFCVRRMSYKNRLKVLQDMQDFVYSIDKTSNRLKKK